MNTLSTKILNVLSSLPSLDVVFVPPAKTDTIPVGEWEIGIGAGLLESPGMVIRNAAGDAPRTTLCAVALSHHPARTLSTEDDITALHEYLRQTRIYARDTSPDAVLSFLIAILRLAGIREMPHQLQAWIDAAALWKFDGNVVGLPEENWCSLHAAGVHALFSLDKGADDEASFAASWVMAVHFLAKALKADVKPLNIPSKPLCSEHIHCQAALEREEDLYKSWLAHADTVQLRLPLSTSDSRHRFVDAIIFEENEATGAAKAFYRNDLKRSPLGRGFDVAMGFRPATAPGNRFVVSANPAAGISLRPVWEAFEVAETAAWQAAGEVRPSNSPRKLPGVEDNPWNDPWWNGGEGFAFIAEPHGGADSSRAGTRLDWKMLQALLWSSANPVKSITVQRLNASGEADAGECALTDMVACEPFLESSKQRCLAMRWAGDLDDTCAALMTPTIGRFMASLTLEAADTKSVTRPSDLNHAPGFRRLTVPGGMVFVTYKGLVAIDDWHQSQLDMQNLTSVCEARLKQLEGLHAISADFRALEEKYRAATQRRKRSAKKIGASPGMSLRGVRTRELEQIMGDAVKLEVRLNQVKRIVAANSEHDPLSGTHEMRHLSETLSDMWGIKFMADQYSVLLSEMTVGLEKLLSTRGRALQRLVFQLGFAITAAAILSEPVGEVISGLLGPDMSQLGGIGKALMAEADGLFEIATAFVLSVCLFVALRGISSWLDRRSARE